jgi:hypothetical protein
MVLVLTTSLNNELNLDNLILAQMAKNFSDFYGIWKYIAVFTTHIYAIQSSSATSDRLLVCVSMQIHHMFQPHKAIHQVYMMTGVKWYTALYYYVACEVGTSKS